MTDMNFTPEQIETAYEVLYWMSEHFAQIDEKDASVSALICTSAGSLCGELFVHLSRGTEIREAFASTAKGDLEIG